MSNVVLYMPVPVDGYITGPDDGMDHGPGASGEWLHDWLRVGDELASPGRSVVATRGGARWAR